MQVAKAGDPVSMACLIQCLVFSHCSKSSYLDWGEADFVLRRPVLRVGAGIWGCVWLHVKLPPLRLLPIRLQYD